MKFASSHEHIQHPFDAYCKKVLKFKARDIYRRRSVLAAREISLSEVPETQLASEDEYFTSVHQFKAHDFDIAVNDELMAEALAMLPEDRRHIVLLYYFLGMNDREIAKMLNLIRETVQYRRTSSLKQLKEYLEGKRYGKDEL